MSEDPAAHSRVDELDFDRADYGGDPKSATCQACQKPIEKAYFSVGEALLCAGCKDRVEDDLSRRAGLGSYMRALSFGIPVAVLGAAIYCGVMVFANMEIALITIAIGFGVGRVVRIASGGLGGIGFQLIAVLLTYLAVVGSFTGGYVYTINEMTDAELQAATEDVSSEDLGDIPAEPTPANGSSELESTPSASSSNQAPSTGQVGESSAGVDQTVRIQPAQYFVLFAIFCVGLPFSLTSDPLSALIIGFGLFEAWRQTRKLKLEITGPHSLEAATT